MRINRRIDTSVSFKRVLHKNSGTNEGFKYYDDGSRPKVILNIFKMAGSKLNRLG